LFKLNFENYLKTKRLGGYAGRTSEGVCKDIG